MSDFVLHEGLAQYTIALGFIERYPLTCFMDERHLDYSTACVREGVNINVCLVGFGKVNQQIFLTSVATNQFICQGGDGVQHKAVNYHVFDKNIAEQRARLNSTYYRYCNMRSGANEQDYLPFPELPAIEQYYDVDANTDELYNALCTVVRGGEMDVNVAIISLGCDELNLEVARKLIAKRQEWGAENLAIFVHVGSCRKHGHKLNAERCTMFDDNPNEQNINKLCEMAKQRNMLYHAVKQQSKRDWLSMDTSKQLSSICACLSLRSKLNLMGLDYCDVTDRSPLSEQQYLDLYQASGGVAGLPQSLRDNFAILEHYRWNAFMITRGFVPSTVLQITDEIKLAGGKQVPTNGVSYAELRHGNLTTFQGLVQYRKLIAKRDGVSELDADVIKYDYQLLDGAYQLLTHCGYKVVHRN